MSDSTSPKVILFSYFRSSCSYRVRIALNLKKIQYEIVPVNLLKGEASSAEHKILNPKGEVPVLLIDGKKFVQSIPIIELLDEIFPNEFRLLPIDPIRRYQARMITEIIGSGIQPLQNLSVLKRIGDEKKAEWAHHYIKTGLEVVEKMLEETSGIFCVGDEITIADCTLIPQIYNGRRWNVDLTKFPNICRIENRLNEIEAFRAAQPNRQIDCPAEEKEKNP